MFFLYPEMLWILWIIPISILAYILIQRRRNKYTLRYSSLLLIRAAGEHQPGFRRHIPHLLFLISIMGMVFSLARPVTNFTLPLQKSTVILAIDVSGSMNLDDMQPTRLEAAKSAAHKFIQNQPSNVNLGVVSFSSTAAVVQAPTKDREAINESIDRLTEQESTAIGSAILTSLDAIFEEPNNKPSPISAGGPGVTGPSFTVTPVVSGTYAPAVIVLLSDGVSNIGPDPLDAVMQAREYGVRIYTIGLGNPGKTVKSYHGVGRQVDLDEDTLKLIAERTDGLYLNAGNETDLLKVYESLGTRLVFEPERIEITVGLTGFATIFLILSGTLSLLWSNRFP
jgi:Ca-activated chloride channel homolog